MSADRGCKLLAMLAWLIISVPRAPKGSSRFRSSGRNFWPVANALRPGGKHKIPQNVSGLRNGRVPAAAGRRGGVAPWRSGLRPPKRRDRSSGTIHLKQIIPLARTWRVDLPALAQAVQAKRRHGVYRCRSSQRRGRPGRRTALQAEQARKTAATRSAAGSGGDGSVWRIWSRWTWRVRARGVSALEAARAACSCRSRPHPQGP